jgi:PD-(D/E)XK endonuclease
LLYQLSYSGAAHIVPSDPFAILTRWNTKALGDRSTLAVMAAFQRAGYGLYIPFGENTRCDLIVDRDGELIGCSARRGVCERAL